MSILAAFMLTAPGMVALHFHRVLSRCRRSDALSSAGMYISYNFSILLLTYGIMYVTRRDRIVSFLPTLDIDSGSSILYSAFVVKFMAITLFFAVVLPLFVRICVIAVRYIVLYDRHSLYIKLVEMLQYTKNDDQFIK
jgi:hypothetical protein